jgi:hypothetical protein
MNMATRTLEELFSFVRDHPTADFYRSAVSDAQRLEDVPLTSREMFAGTPLSSRRYKEVKSLQKIARLNDIPFISEWDFEDISKEAYGETAARPMVYMSNAHEALEKSMWCYGRGVVPLAGETDPALAIYAASKYRIDGLITDPAALSRIAPHMPERTEPLGSITLIADSFDVRSLMRFAPLAQRVRLVLALPETGAFAQAELSASPVFKPVPDCLIERQGNAVVVTKFAQLVTPIIRYKVDIQPDLFFDGVY